MYSGKQNRDEINKGLCLVNVSNEHPVYNLVKSYQNEIDRNAILKKKVANLEKAMTNSAQGPPQGKFLAGTHSRAYSNVSGLASSITDQPDKPKKKKKKRSKAMTLGSYKLR